MRSLQHKVSNTKSTNVPITLAEDYNIIGIAKGIRALNWKTDDGNISIKLSNTVFVPNLSMSLVSIPSLVSNAIAVLFKHAKAVLINVGDDFSTLGYATQEEEGLFYIDEFQKSVT